MGSFSALCALLPVDPSSSSTSTSTSSSSGQRVAAYFQVLADNGGTDGIIRVVEGRGDKEAGRRDYTEKDFYSPAPRDRSSDLDPHFESGILDPGFHERR